MKCHYVYDKEVGKVLIPGCWPVVISGNIEDCICQTEKLSEAHFEKERYQSEISKRDALIKDLQEENELLRQDIDKYITIIEENKWKRKE